MTEIQDHDLEKLHLVRDLSDLQEIERGEREITYVNAPWGEIIEVTAFNSEAVQKLCAHTYASRYPELFDGFDREQTSFPTEDEIFASAGGPFGSINDWRN